MGLIRNLFGLGRVVRDVAEVFVPNKTEAQAQSHIEKVANYAQYAEEFRQVPGGRFDRFVNALNRLPRPVLAMGTVGLFGYAMIDPSGFSARMRGLQLVPEPLWWLLGAVVSFYFGARELHYLRQRNFELPAPLDPRETTNDQPKDDNPALRVLRKAE
ncbi:MAG: holin family protein [Pseudomonadota bacterium]